MESSHLSSHPLVPVIARLLPQIQMGLLMRKSYLNSSVHVPKKSNFQKADQRDMHILVSPSPASTQTITNTSIRQSTPVIYALLPPPSTQAITDMPVRQFTPAICTLFIFGLVVFLGVSRRMLFPINGTQLLSGLRVRVLTRTHLFNLKTIIPLIQARRRSLENKKENKKVIVSAELHSPFLHVGQRWITVRRLKILTPHRGLIEKGQIGTVTELEGFLKGKLTFDNENRQYITNLRIDGDKSLFKFLPLEKS